MILVAKSLSYIYTLCYYLESEHIEKICFLLRWALCCVAYKNIEIAPHPGSMWWSKNVRNVKLLVIVELTNCILIILQRTCLCKLSSIAIPISRCCCLVCSNVSVPTFISCWVGSWLIQLFPRAGGGHFDTIPFVFLVEDLLIERYLWLIIDTNMQLSEPEKLEGEENSMSRSIIKGVRSICLSKLHKWVVNVKA